MRTEFSLAQLADPRVAASEKILRSCVHCGFCTATCPTYLLLGDERDSPRGRIYMIKDMLEGGKPAGEEVVTHVDRCLSCLSCMTTCPSGVHYMHLVDHARSHVEETHSRPFAERLLRAALAKIMPDPERLRIALRLAALGRPFRGIVAKLPQGARLAAMLDLAGRPVAGDPAMTGPRVFKPAGERRARVAILSGCAQSVLAPGINEAAIRVLTRLGVEVVLPAGEGCCGALVHHMGRDHDSHEAARANVAAWTREIEGGGLDAILVTTSGCGTTIKDYGFMLRGDSAWRDKAARVAALAKDVSEFLDGLGGIEPVAKTGLTVAYHSACSMQHGQKILEAPKRLLRKAGFVVRDPPEGHICCGSAGVYNVLQPEIAGRLRARKVANVERTKPDLVAAGNLGCMIQIGKGTTLPIVHTVELLDWAAGGPKPKALAGLA